MSSTGNLTEPAKLLLLVTLLAKDHIISNNAKAFVKELILRRDPRLKPLIDKFESKEANDVSFLEQLHELIANEAHALYEDLFADTSLEVGKALSKSEREVKQLNEDKSLIYGEVEFASFYRVLRKINPEPGVVFYDLGSGTGKALLVARLVQDFSKCIGIEILNSLHTQAEKIIHRFNTTAKNALMLGQSQYAQVYEGSFLDFDWSDGDVVFANSTCFSDELMLSLSKQAETLKPGAIVVTFTKGMTTPAFELLERKRYRMSWGPATVFIHRKLRDDGKPVGPAKLNILPSDSLTYDDEMAMQDANRFQSYQSQGNDDDDDDEDEDDDEGSYDVDIDYNIRNPDGEDDDEEEDDEEEEDDDEEDDEDDEEDDEEEDEEDEEDEDEDDDDYNEMLDKELEAKLSFFNSPSKNQESKVASPYKSPEKASKLVGSSPVARSPASASSTASNGRPVPSPNYIPVSVSPSKETPNRDFAKSNSAEKKSPTMHLAMSSPANVGSASEAFAMLNSPQDTALLMRRRNKPPAKKVDEMSDDDQ